MPNKYQKVVTIPKDIYEKVAMEVHAGREVSVSNTFVRAVEEYLSKKRRSMRSRMPRLGED